MSRKVVVCSVSFSSEVLARLTQYAERLGQSRSSLINQLVRGALGLPPDSEQIREGSDESNHRD